MSGLRRLLFSITGKLAKLLATWAARLGGWKYGNVIYVDDEDWFP